MPLKSQYFSSTLSNEGPVISSCGTEYRTTRIPARELRHGRGLLYRGFKGIWRLITRGENLNRQHAKVPWLEVKCHCTKGLLALNQATLKSGLHLCAMVRDSRSRSDRTTIQVKATSIAVGISNLDRPNCTFFHNKDTFLFFMKLPAVLLQTAE